MKKIPNKVPSAQNAQSRKKRHWKQFVTTVSCLVVFCTVYALILPAVTLDKNKVYCNQEVHVHTDDCYQMVADQAEPPAEDVLVSSPEFPGDPETLADGTPIGETAQADEGFMDAAPVEENAEADPQTAEGEQQATTPQEPSVHKELICQIPEHEHSRQCESNPEEVETREDWIKTIPEEKDLKEDLKERVLQIAESQLGYKESDKNFQVNENGSENGFTRYGAWLGEPYADWNSAFVGWVLNYSRADVPFDKDLAKWVEDLGDTLIQEPQPGMVAFFRDETANLRTGFFKETESKDKEAGTDESKTNSKEDQETILLIEGDQNGEVKESSVKKDQIFAYLNLEKEKPDSDESNAGSQGEQDSVTDVDASTGSSTENQNSTAGSDLNSESQTNVTVSSSESSAENDSEKSVSPSAENTDEKSVEVTGQDNAEVGQVVTLTANTEGFASEENLVYQWQFKVDEDNWQNLENGTEKTIQILVDEENIHWDYRVGVKEYMLDEYGNPINSYQKRSISLKALEITDIRRKLLPSTHKDLETDEADDPSESEFDAVTTFELTSNEAAAYSLQQIIKSDQVEITKGWTQPHSSVKEVTVNIFAKESSENRRQIDSVRLSEENNWKYSWQNSSYDVSNLVFEEETISGWTASYSELNRIIDYQLNGEPASYLVRGYKYLITDNSQKYCLYYDADGRKKSLPIPDDLNQLPDDAWWRVDSNKRMKNSRERYLVLNGRELSTSTSESNGTNFAYSNLNGIMQDNGKRYLVYQNEQFVHASKSNKSIRTKIYKCLETPITIRNILITNSPSYGGNQGEGTGDDILANGFPISKRIDYLGDGVENLDSGSDSNLENRYRLYLSAGPIAGDAAASPVNVLYILDSSGSMANEYTDEETGKKVQYFSDAKDAIYNSWSAVQSLNTKSQASVITFGQTATIAQNWTSSNIMINQPANGGTNYDAALKLADQQIRAINNAYPVFIIFLTDGLATYAGNCVRNTTYACIGTGSDHKRTDVQSETLNSISIFRTNHPNANISFIGYHMDVADGKLLDPYGYSDSLATGNQIYAADEKEVIKQMTAIIAGPTITKGIIRDKLSSNVEFAENMNPILVAINKADGTSQKMWPKPKDAEEEEIENGFTLETLKGTTEGYDQVFAGLKEGEEPVTWNKRDGTIQVTFGPDWSMNTRYEYVLSFDIEVPKTTYESYIDNGYPKIGNTVTTGDSKTDYESNITSSDKVGFYSNISEPNSTAFSFIYNGKAYDREYAKPVVQVQQKLTVHKIDSVDPNKSLPGAEFSLQPTNPAGDSVTQITDDEGNAVFTGISDGTYTLREVNPPIGYNASTTTWEIKVENGKFTVNDREPENGSVKSDSGLYIAYKTNITNTAGKPLPNTGGPGNNFYTSTGIALLAAGLFVYRYKNRFSGSERGSK